MRKMNYLAGTILGTALVVAGGFATPALAQDTTATTASGASTTAQTEDEDSGEAIVVTGTLFRTTANATPSPVTVVTTESLDQRGISTVQDAIQTLASNNGPALTNSFTANGAFSAGASAVSLRGLSTSSTLVLFDGLRASYYPLADDGSRNFVDLNTIPDDIVDRIEVLRDGASSTYGADAIAGVVNIITKRELTGVHARAETGIAQRGDAASYRLSLSAGIGDLDAQGFNAYLSGFYYRSDSLMNRDRPFPYNGTDLRALCFEGTCGADVPVNGLAANGLYAGVSTSGSFTLRPYDATNTTAQGPFMTVGPCARGSVYTLTAADRAQSANFPASACRVDYVGEYGFIQPQVERFGGSGRVTARLGDTVEGYAEFNFIQTTSSYSGNPGILYGNAPTGIVYQQYSTSQTAGRAPGSGPLTLPVYVCPERVNCAASPNRRLNPNNPYAAQGFVARLTGRDLSRPTYNETRNRSYRAAFGANGNITDNITFNFGATAMHTDLHRLQENYVYIQHLLDVIADGSYNFLNPAATPQSVVDYLMPPNVGNLSSDLYQVEGSVGATLFDLPGGPLQLAAGASIRYEAVNSPSGNPDYNGPTQRYFTLNAFGTVGNRTVKSAFAEIDAPILSFVDVNLSGRYDSYSSGQDAFSPKVGVKVTPIRQLVLRGTYSRGFRIPSFGEANALPTTGYVFTSATQFTDAFLAQYATPGNPCSVASFSTCPAYVRGQYGLTTLASPNLQPEKSRSFTAGAVFEPIRGVSFTVDYYNIKKSGGIANPDTTAAIASYYAGTPNPDPSINLVAGAPSPQFPNATPIIGFVEATLVNAETIRAEGIDFTASAEFGLMEGLNVSTSIEASYLINLSTETAVGVQSYEGTLGNYALTAGSGTQEWRGSWQTTLDFGQFALTGTANYIDGYDLSAEDVTGPGTSGNCALNPGYTPCRVSSYTTFDLSGRFKVNDQFTFYATALNLFDRLPPIDPATYGANNYNPVQGGLGILGRYFKAGVRVKF